MFSIASILIVLFGTTYTLAISDTVVLGVEWEAYKATFGKYYSNILEEEYRYQIFKENKLKIALHNRLYAAGLKTFDMGINEFSDMTTEEFFWIYTMDNYTMSIFEQNNNDIRIYNDTFLPDAPNDIDWRSKGAVTPVKRQRTCGSCWAFAAIGALESAHALKYHKLIGLSEQNLVDCSKENYGCKGGHSATALQYIKNNNGVDMEKSYPYVSKEQQCRFNRNTVGATVTNVQFVNKNEESLRNVVGNAGPVAMGLIVADSLHHYRSGVYNEDRCQTMFRHAMVIIGYGDDSKGGPYWMVKNSWGSGWGEGGYIRIARNKNICGIMNDCVLPTA